MSVICNYFVFIVFWGIEVGVVKGRVIVLDYLVLSVRWLWFYVEGRVCILVKIEFGVDGSKFLVFFRDVRR